MNEAVAGAFSSERLGREGEREYIFVGKSFRVKMSATEGRIYSLYYVDVFSKEACLAVCRRIYKYFLNQGFFR